MKQYCTIIDTPYDSLEAKQDALEYFIDKKFKLTLLPANEWLKNLPTFAFNTEFSSERVAIACDYEVEANPDPFFSLVSPYPINVVRRDKSGSALESHTYYLFEA